MRITRRAKVKSLLHTGLSAVDAEFLVMNYTKKGWRVVTAGYTEHGYWVLLETQP